MQHVRGRWNLAGSLERGFGERFSQWLVAE
jgi:hypothetical protein